MGASLNAMMLFPSRRPFDIGRVRNDILADWNADDYATKMTDQGLGAISQWTDSVSGISLTDAGVALNRPTYSATGLAVPSGSTFPAVSFAGAVTTLVNTTDTILNSLGAAECEIFAVVAGVNDATARTIIQFGSITNGANRVMRKNATTNSMLIGDSTINVSSLAGTTLASAAVCNGQFQTTQYRTRVNGTIGANSAAATLNTGGGTIRIRMGANNANTAGAVWSGTIARVMVIRMQTEPRRHAIEAWLAWRYDLQTLLAPNNPFREKRP